MRDCEVTFGGYERVGVPEYWLIGPERREAAFYRRDGEPYPPGGTYRAVALADDLFESKAVAGLRIGPQSLFEDLAAERVRCPLSASRPLTVPGGARLQGCR